MNCARDDEAAFYAWRRADAGGGDFGQLHKVGVGAEEIDTQSRDFEPRIDRRSVKIVLDDEASPITTPVGEGRKQRALIWKTGR